LHGLEAAPSNWVVTGDPSSTWISGDIQTDADGNEYDKTQITLNGNTSTAIGTGLANSTAIITQSELTASAGSAAKLCRDYRGGGLDDWFLPSKDELAQLYANQDVNRWGGFAEDYYWTSSEYNAKNAWSQHFITGKQPGTYKSYERLVRPVRAFAF
jgi:hypothetical protein